MARATAERNTVLVADDDRFVRELLAEALSDTEFDCQTVDGGRSALAALGEHVVVALLDLNMPEPDGLACLQHIRQHHPQVETIICTGSAEIEDAVEAMKAGAFDYLTKPINPAEVVELTRRAAERSLLRSENRELKQALSPPNITPAFIGESAPAQQVKLMAQKFAGLTSTVLITGESGVGKGLLARLIHQAGPRANRPFVSISCTSLPRDLVEAELFGHEKGAFTGAHDRRPGRVEMAKGGTLFLDEIGDMPIDLQPKLLTFLQDRQFQRIGSNQTIEVDVRVIAATNQDLKKMCRERKFREDLYFRLNVLPIEIPPLRERGADVELLAEFLLKQIAHQRALDSLSLSPDALTRLVSYHWPGNVRELENVLERSSAFCEGSVILPADLPPELLGARDLEENPAPSRIGGMTLQDLERMAIIQTLELCKGNKSKAARSLGISEKSIYNKMRRLDIS